MWKLYIVVRPTIFSLCKILNDFDFVLDELKTKYANYSGVVQNICTFHPLLHLS